MKIFETIKNIFGKKSETESETESKIIKKDFDIEEFNEWFMNDFTGYDGRKGAIGIFLRTDKLSSNWIKEYLISIGQDDSYENVEYHYQIVRKDWRNKLSK